LLAEELRLRRADRLLVRERSRLSEELVAELLELRDQFRCGAHRNEKTGDSCGAAGKVTVEVGSLRADDALKRDRVANRDLGEHLAVQLDVARVELADQLRIADAERTRCRVDALDPQRAEVALLDLARAVHV